MYKTVVQELKISIIFFFFINFFKIHNFAIFKKKNF